MKGAVRLASSDNGALKPSEEILSKLIEKYPPRPLDRLVFPEDESLPFQASEIQVLMALKSFPVGSAVGLSGLRPQHLKDITSHKANGDLHRLMSSLTSFNNLLLRAKVPTKIQPVIAGAKLLALRKKLTDVRPKAVGDTLRRLAAKTGCEAITAKAKSLFGNLQLGCCTPSRAEALAHATRAFCYTATEQEVLVKLDFANAFNAIRRDKTAESINREIPELLPFFKLCYSEDSILSFGDFSLPSSEGWQQGDPLAGFGFSSTIHPGLDAIKTRFKQGYLDDISMGDNWRVVLTEMRAFIELATSLGISLNAN